jgi:hypothetical protein
MWKCAVHFRKAAACAERIDFTLLAVWPEHHRLQFTHLKIIFG